MYVSGFMSTLRLLFNVEQFPISFFLSSCLTWNLGFRPTHLFACTQLISIVNQEIIHYIVKYGYWSSGKFLVMKRGRSGDLTNEVSLYFSYSFLSNFSLDKIFTQPYERKINLGRKVISCWGAMRAWKYLPASTTKRRDDLPQPPTWRKKIVLTFAFPLIYSALI